MFIVYGKKFKLSKVFNTISATLHFLTDNKLKWQPLDDNFDTVVLNDGEGNYDRFKITKKTPGSERTWDTLEDMLKAGIDMLKCINKIMFHKKINRG